MDTLPPYQASTPPHETSLGAQAGVGTSIRAGTIDNASSASIVDAPGVVGGSGVRLPLSSEERVSYDRRTCTRLRTFGPYVRTRWGMPSDSPLRTETFHPDVLYQSAASQLNVLLPALSPTTLPTTTALRTITLRIDTPPPDASWGSEVARTGLVQGRAVLAKAFKGWMLHYEQKKGEQALFEMADAITGRLAMEGFLVLEEWWDPRRGLLFLTVRC